MAVNTKPAGRGYLRKARHTLAPLQVPICSGMLPPLVPQLWPARATAWRKGKEVDLGPVDPWSREK